MGINEQKCLRNNISVMKNAILRTKFNHQKLKTFCTLDTSDVGFIVDLKQSIERKKLIPYSSKNKTNTKQTTNTKHTTSKHTTSKHETFSPLNKKQQNHTISHQKYQRSISKTNTITTETKPKKPHHKTHSRTKTEQLESSPKKMSLNNLQIFTTIKNIKFHMDEKYNVEPFYLVNTLKQTNEQTIQTVKYLARNKKSQFFILKKSNHPKTVSKYQQEILIKEQLTDKLKVSEKKNLSCLYKVYKKDKQGNMMLVYNMEGESLSWKKNLSRKLIQNLPKNDMQILKHLIVQLSKAIHILSTYGYYHSQIRLKNVLVELKEDEENVKVSKVVKLANLCKCFKVKDKKSFQFMPHSIYTPPSILNFMIFENADKNFNRSWLEYIYKYEDAWRINVWSLGILVLELLNEEPLNTKFLELAQIIDFQKHIQQKCTTIFDKISDQSLQILLKRMLSTNPNERPSPQQIILSLTP